MVGVMKIDGMGKVRNMLSGYTRTIPRASDRGAYNSARFGGMALKQEAKRVGLKHWGGGKRQLFSRQTGARKRGKGIYMVVMPIHGIYQDRAKPHWVSIKRGRLLAKWAKDRGFTGKAFYFRPRPFINKAVKRTVKKTKKIVEKEINKAIRRKGKR